MVIVKWIIIINTSGFILIIRIKQSRCYEILLTTSHPNEIDVDNDNSKNDMTIAKMRRQFMWLI